MKKYKLHEVCQLFSVNDEIIVEFIRNEWIEPASPKNEKMDFRISRDPKTPIDCEFDDEDLARIRLILDLMNVMGVNTEAVPIILHLVDQVHHFRAIIPSAPA